MEEIVDEHFKQNFRFDEPGLQRNFKKDKKLIHLYFDNWDVEQQNHYLKRDAT